MSGTRSLYEVLPPEGDELCVYAAGRDTSRTALRSLADALSAAIADSGAPAGSLIGVMLPNGPALVASLLATWKAGCVYMPLNPRATDTEVTALIASLDPAVVITNSQLVDRFAGRAVVAVERDAGERDAVQIREGARGAGRFDPGVALVQFTSGTTGAPKAVPLEHATVLGLLDTVLGSLRAPAPAAGPANLTPNPSTSSPSKPAMPNLIPVSLSLWAGIYQVLFAFRVGAPVVLMDGFDTAEFASLVQRFGIKSTVLPPAAMVMLADDERIADLSPLRYVRSISSPLSPLQARRFRDRFGIAIMNCYGQTELGGEVVGWSAPEAKEFGESKLGAVGRPHKGNELRVDEHGEIWVRTPMLASGGGDRELLGDRLTADGWLRTGDIGSIDEDGFLWIEGRQSDMINRGGLKVHPAEVEEVLRLSRGVADAAVVGMPDDRLGEVPWAFCVPIDPDAPLPASAELEQLCRTHLAPYKIPVRYVPVDELPRNEVGKVLRRVLAEQA